MDCYNEKSSLEQKHFSNVKRDLNGESADMSMRDMPLETRRKEAKKPLFLIRYE
jgi:hypothetical protein